MVMYYQTEFVCKQIKSLEGIEEKKNVYINPWCDLDPEDSRPTFLHDTPAHDNAPQYHV